MIDQILKTFFGLEAATLKRKCAKNEIKAIYEHSIGV